jgi:polar amino acid transport system ATP-binding protein
MAEGKIIEQGPPDSFFSNPQHPKTQTFLGQILSNHHA